MVSTLLKEDTPQTLGLSFPSFSFLSSSLFLPPPSPPPYSSERRVPENGKGTFWCIWINSSTMVSDASFLKIFLPAEAAYPLFQNTSLSLEKETAPHSSTHAWKIPWTEEPGRLQSMGSLRVGHDWGTSLSLFTFMHWRRKWQPTPVFLSGESQGWGSLVGCHLWGHTESDMTEVT